MVIAAIRNSLVLAAVYLLLAHQAAPAAAATEGLLEPASPWNVDTVDGSCRLRRMFGTPEAPLLLQLSTSSPGTSFEFRLYGAEVNLLLPSEDVSDGVQVDFGIGNPVKVNGLAGTRGANAGLMIFETKLPTLGASYEVRDFDPIFLEQSSRLAFAAAGHRIVLHAGNPREALAAMSECANALVARWGLDPKVQASLSRPAVPQDKDMFERKLMAQYPTSQARAGKGGLIDIVALIDSNGTVTKCFVPNSIGHSDFGETACKAIKKLPFTPALDQDGKAVASFYGTSMIYLMG